MVSAVTSYRFTAAAVVPVRGALDGGGCQTADVVLALIHLEDWCVHCNCPNTPPGSSWFSRVLHSRRTFVTSWTQISDRRRMKHEREASSAPRLWHPHVCGSWRDAWRAGEEERRKGDDKGINKSKWKKKLRKRHERRERKKMEERREQSSFKRRGRNEVNAENRGRIEMRCEEDERKNKCVKYKVETNRRWRRCRTHGTVDLVGIAASCQHTFY